MTPVHFLWFAAIAFFVVADAVTTSVGIGVFGAIEGHPVSTVTLATAGGVGLLAAKGVVIGVAFTFARRSPRKYRAAFPATLAAYGVVVAAWNIAVILATVA